MRLSGTGSTTDFLTSIDNRYWERKTEQSRESGSSKSGHKASSDSKSGSSSKSGHQSSSTTASTPSKGNSGGSAPKTPAKSPAKPYSDKLGKDGKLTPEERQRRLANNLCLFCGGPSRQGNSGPGPSSGCRSGCQGVKKLVRGPPNSVPVEDRVDSLGTEIVKLNASALSDPSSLHIQLYSDSIPTQFRALIDSGSSHCFLDSQFVEQYGVPTNSVPPLRLSLFDGSSNHVITQSTTLPVHFPSGEVIDIDFYVTPLDKSVS
ncbi:hypothetical protein OH77DRAFT_1582321, partial [Trametes cingulata]